METTQALSTTELTIGQTTATTVAITQINGVVSATIAILLGIAVGTNPALPEPRTMPAAFLDSSGFERKSKYSNEFYNEPGNWLVLFLSNCLMCGQYTA